MSYMMDCASGQTAARREQIAREAKGTLLEDISNFPFPEICEAWNAPDLGDEFRAPLRSDVPVLFISGTLDARTPISNAEEYSKGFSKQHAHNHRRRGPFRSVVSVVTEDQGGNDGVFERTASDEHEDHCDANEVCSLATDLTDPADKSIITDPEAPRFVDPLLGIVDADSVGRERFDAEKLFRILRAKLDRLRDLRRRVVDRFPWQYRVCRDHL